MEGRPRRWDELIGSGPPPVKTREGWLHLYHGVATHFGAANVYQAGVALHDLDEPWRVLHRGAFNILEPREPWELTGQVPNVVFPSGMIVERVDGNGFAIDDSPVRVYYGAADTVVGVNPVAIQINRTKSKPIPLSGPAQPVEELPEVSHAADGEHDGGKRRGHDHEPDPPVPKRQPRVDHLLVRPSPGEVDQGPDRTDQEQIDG